MWFLSKSRDFASQSLRRLRRKVLDEGEPLFRVLSTSGKVRDFAVGPDGSESYKVARAAAFDFALDLASLDVGSSVFVSERRELDGVQVLVRTSEVSWSMMGGTLRCLICSLSW